MFSFIKKRFLHRFIIVYQDDIDIDIHIYDMKNKKVINKADKIFMLENKDTYTQDMIDYINQKQDEVTRSYVVTLINSQGQGIVPTCSTSKFKKYSVDRRYTYNLCIDGLFANYVSKIEINWIQKVFSQIGIDLIFSPFLLLKDIAYEDKIINQTVLYILYINYKVTLLIKNDDGFIYGAFFNTHKEENLLYSNFEDNFTEEFEVEDDIEIENDEISEDIEIEDKNDSEKNIEEIMMNVEDRTFTGFLSSSLKEFYSNQIYSSNFIDSVKIYSEEEIDKSVVTYIENELFLSTESSHIELDPIVLKYCQKEVLGV